LEKIKFHFPKKNHVVQVRAENLKLFPFADLAPIQPFLKNFNGFQAGRVGFLLVKISAAVEARYPDSSLIYNRQSQFSIRHAIYLSLFPDSL
jgi:hypothetical protein